jgi:glycine hydroxymethyltransferase
MIVAGASAYSRLIDYERLRAIADEVSAYLLTDMAHIAGLVAAGVIPSPVPHSDFVTFTTYKTFGAGRGGVILCRAPFARQIDKSIFPASQGTPDLTAVAAKAVGFQMAQRSRFRALQKEILANAVAMAQGFHARGYRIVSGGTDNHLVLVDLGSKGLTGKAAETVLASVGIVVNRNAIPYDRLGPEITSGMRLGASAITTRGMGRAQVAQIVDWIDTALQHAETTSMLAEIESGVKQLCQEFPVYREQ